MVKCSVYLNRLVFVIEKKKKKTYIMLSVALLIFFDMLNAIAFTLNKKFSHFSLGIQYLIAERTLN